MLLQAARQRNKYRIQQGKLEPSSLNSSLPCWIFKKFRGRKFLGETSEVGNKKTRRG